MKKKIALLMACVMAFGIAVGGTLAWLTDETDSVVNTFTATDIEITLAETEDNWNKKMIPGATYTKDPIVAVTDETTVDCYLFVKFEETENASTYLTYTSNLTEDNGWKKVAGEDDVWYRIVKTTDATKSWHLLAEDEVTVNGETVTKDNMSAAAATKLTYTAYAAQLMEDNDTPFTPDAAWNLVKPA